MRSYRFSDTARNVHNKMHSHVCSELPSVYLEIAMDTLTAERNLVKPFE